MDAMRQGNMLNGKTSVYSLRSKNEALGPQKDLAHEGFGTYEDKFSNNPLSETLLACHLHAIPLNPHPEILMQMQVQMYGIQCMNAEFHA